MGELTEDARSSGRSATDGVHQSACRSGKSSGEACAREATAVKTRVLGKTGLVVSEIGFGSMELRGPRIWDGRPVSPVQADEILNAALDLGVNFIDTSPDYGQSEQYIGRFLSARRDEYILATKCGCHLVDKGAYDETTHVWTRRNILANVEESLERLRTDHVDILQLHNATVEDVRQNEVMDVLQEIKDSGKARFIGASSTWPDLLEFINTAPLDTIQTTYSALDPSHQHMISAAKGKGMGTIVRGAVMKGAMTDLLQRNLVENIRKTLGMKELWESARLDELLEDMTPTEFLVRFALTHPDVNTVIIGTLNSEHLKGDLAAAKAGPLPNEMYEEAVRRLRLCGIRPAWTPQGRAD